MKLTSQATSQICFLLNLPAALPPPAQPTRGLRAGREGALAVVRRRRPARRPLGKQGPDIGRVGAEEAVPVQDGQHAGRGAEQEQHIPGKEDI